MIAPKDMLSYTPEKSVKINVRPLSNASMIGGESASKPLNGMTKMQEKQVDESLGSDMKLDEN